MRISFLGCLANHILNPRGTTFLWGPRNSESSHGLGLGLIVLGWIRNSESFLVFFGGVRNSESCVGGIRNSESSSVFLWGIRYSESSHYCVLGVIRNSESCPVFLWGIRIPESSHYCVLGGSEILNVFLCSWGDQKF